MKTILQVLVEVRRSGFRFQGSRFALVLAGLVILVHLSASAADAISSFASPEQAAAALATGMKTQDRDALRALFGPALEDIENPDRVQATNEFAAFAAALDQKYQVVRESGNRYVIEVGTNSWPFPIPIVQRSGGWLFDTAAGKEELLNRRIGKNELKALEVMRAYVDAQREYASRDHDGDQVLEYAQKITSSEGQTDGLYWPPELNGEISPLGPMIAQAQGQGYFGGGIDPDQGPRPFYGYYFKILKKQGKHAPGGKYNYVINGNMIGGFAMVAWPAEYGHSGIMTLIVNQQGVVYQQDLGPKTSKLASKMTAYDPDPAWRPSAE